MRFLYTNNKLSEREIKKTISFAIATTPKNKVPKNKFTKEENYRTLNKEIEEGTNK